MHVCVSELYSLSADSTCHVRILHFIISYLTFIFTNLRKMFAESKFPHAFLLQMSSCSLPSAELTFVSVYKPVKNAGWEISMFSGTSFPLVTGCVLTLCNSEFSSTHVRILCIIITVEMNWAAVDHSMYSKQGN